MYRNQPLKPTLTFDTIDRQRDRTKKLYRMLKEPLGTAKHLSEQSKDFIGYSKRCAIACIKKKLDEMGHLHLLLDEMGSWTFPKLQKSYRQLLYRRDRESSP